ncbi:hypothetical protein LZ30DRAFT_772910 [Colletotrichum cereale]|nr:hypothetical protein LZ30DRAFT_772910 [Colletotrichum cereale]
MGRSVASSIEEPRKHSECQVWESEHFFNPFDHSLSLKSFHFFRTDPQTNASRAIKNSYDTKSDTGKGDRHKEDIEDSVDVFEFRPLQDGHLGNLFHTMVSSFSASCRPKDVGHKVMDGIVAEIEDYIRALGSCYSQRPLPDECHISDDYLYSAGILSLYDAGKNTSKFSGSAFSHLSAKPMVLRTIKKDEAKMPSFHPSAWLVPLRLIAKKYSKHTSTRFQPLQINQRNMSVAHHHHNQSALGPQNNDRFLVHGGIEDLSRQNYDSLSTYVAGLQHSCPWLDRNNFDQIGTPPRPVHLSPLNLLLGPRHLLSEEHPVENVSVRRNQTPILDDSTVLAWLNDTNCGNFQCELLANGNELAEDGTPSIYQPRNREALAVSIGKISDFPSYGFEKSLLESEVAPNIFAVAHEEEAGSLEEQLRLRAQAYPCSILLWPLHHYDDNGHNGVMSCT